MVTTTDRFTLYVRRMRRAGSVRRIFVIKKFSNPGFLENLRSPSLGYERRGKKSGQTPVLNTNPRRKRGVLLRRLLSTCTRRRERSRSTLLSPVLFPTSVLRSVGRRSTSGLGSVISHTAIPHYTSRHKSDGSPEDIDGFVPAVRYYRGKRFRVEDIVDTEITYIRSG